jgi:hypothetical protein
MVASVVQGGDVECRRGGKEVHAADVARAVQLLLAADPAAITGEAFNCYDRYVSDHEVATIASRLSKSPGAAMGEPSRPRHEIATAKLASLGMTYGGTPLLEQTVQQLIDSIRGV